MLESILHLDAQIFHWINDTLSNSFFDQVMPFIRNKYTWVPLYVFLLSFVWINFGKKVWIFLFFALLTVSMTDVVSSKLVKKNFKRTRPCNTEYLMVNERIPCGSGYSFTSSHATNHFGLAQFFFLSLMTAVGGWRWFFFLWAGLIGFAQIYVGVHYPGDVIGGAALGIFCGSLVYWLYKHKSGQYFLNSNDEHR